MFKKFLISIMITATAVGSFASITSAAVPIDVIVDGKKQSFPDTEPLINAQGTTMVPLRFVSEKLGAEVLWDNATQTATINKNGKSVSLVVDGQQAVKVEGRTLVPLRFVSENLDSTVKWDKDAYAINIVSRTFQEQLDKKEVTVDAWGRILAPKQNSLNWILMEDISTEAYMKKLRSVTAEGSSISSKEYFSSGRLYKSNADRLALNVKNYYDLALNVDYRTVTKEGYYSKVLSTLGYAKTPSSTNFYSYVDHVKKNKIITEGYAFPEQSMIYRNNGTTFARTKIKFKIVQSSDMGQFFPDNFDPSSYSDKAKGIKAGVWYEGWVDISLYSNVANDQLNTYKVGSTENMFIKGLYSYKELK